MGVQEKDSFASRFAEALTDAGIPDNRDRRKHVAKMFKVSVETVRKWLTGIAKPQPNKIQSIARKLRVNGEWLLTGIGLKSGHDAGSQAVAVTADGAALSALSVSIPLLDVRASMGIGYMVPEYESVIDNLRLSQEWCKRNLSVSSLSNLAALSAYGDSMRPTFEDGDILLVDRGITELKIDAVYVLQFRDELYVKRVQRRPDGALVIKSDNALYDPFTIEPESNGLRVLGRVIWAWNGKKL